MSEAEFSPAAAPRPQGRYVTAVAGAGLLVSAGMTPRAGGELVLRGRAGAELDTVAAAGAARIAARNALAALAGIAGGPDGIGRLLRMTVYVACTDDFTALSAVADGASAALAEMHGAEALPARSAIGVRALPDGAPVEVELMAAAVTENPARRRQP
ncbi:enamine deaminase RidA (YjgF/YER057c/UK114 family) [Spinactinospora alkalitolerans]|uniref:Enamine deaminase RidA (YjgF/YER057c/UK114 family) n=1 Tax=Spinactinospora alkalitolerans TaxID=687207 RepID=A0A852U1B9_9ACTN|nr:RidA family protein [Spinactinospora alkalitolerans]NYE47964.1 enamine deaminase RidA (YjgF/YER057c/UK114 family) [Spinactinospora alkalitolerans]